MTCSNENVCNFQLILKVCSHEYMSVIMKGTVHQDQKKNKCGTYTYATDTTVSITGNLTVRGGTKELRFNCHYENTPIQIY